MKEYKKVTMDVHFTVDFAVDENNSDIEQAVRDFLMYSNYAASDIWDGIVMDHAKFEIEGKYPNFDAAFDHAYVVLDKYGLEMSEKREED